MAAMNASFEGSRLGVFAGLPQFRSVWPARGWSWDSRYDCIASTIAVDYADEAWNASLRIFQEVWDEGKMRAAPSIVRRIGEQTGGVRSDQYILTTAQHDDLMLYGLWWPWGGESSHISMRMGLAGDASDDDRNELRELFKVADD